MVSAPRYLLPDAPESTAEAQSSEYARLLKNEMPLSAANESRHFLQMQAGPRKAIYLSRGAT